VCEPNTSVSSGALDDGATRLQETLALGVFDDEEGGAVFDRATRVLKFGLSKHIAASLFGEALEADEGSFADGYIVESAWKPQGMNAGYGTIKETPLSNALGFGDVDRSLLCSLYLAEALCIPPCRGSETSRSRPEHCCCAERGKHVKMGKSNF
jgi:hypothetical protein